MCCVRVVVMFLFYLCFIISDWIEFGVELNEKLLRNELKF